MRALPRHAGRRGHDLHGPPGERVPRPPDARAAGPGRSGWCGRAGAVFRFIRPEQLARPEGFRNFLDYLTVLKAPTSPWLPSEWSAEMLMNWLTPGGGPVADRQALGGGAMPRSRSGALVHRRLFLLGYSKAQEGAERKVRRPLRGPAGEPARLAPAAEARVPVQGHAAVLPRQHPVEPADPARGAADRSTSSTSSRCRSTPASGFPSRW